MKNEIEEFLKNTKMTRSRFGRESIGQPLLCFSYKIFPHHEPRIRNYIATMEAFSNDLMEQIFYHCCQNSIKMDDFYRSVGFKFPRKAHNFIFSGGIPTKREMKKLLPILKMNYPKFDHVRVRKTPEILTPFAATCRLLRGHRMAAFGNKMCFLFLRIIDKHPNPWWEEIYGRPMTPEEEADFRRRKVRIFIGDDKKLDFQNVTDQKIIDYFTEAFDGKLD